MKKWTCFSIFEVKGELLASSKALFGIILFLSDSNKKEYPHRLIPERILRVQ